jgi:NAD-dependent SIR2 family protein deacetylase
MIFSKYEDKFEDDLTCPYCNYEFTDSWESCTESSEIIDCPECEKKFYGWMQKSIDYKSKPDCKINNEKHQFENVSDGWLKCKICGELKMEKSNE